MSALTNPISGRGFGTSRSVGTARRKEDGQRLTLYSQVLQDWSSYSVRITEIMPRISRAEARRFAARTKVLQVIEQPAADDTSSFVSEEMRFLTENSRQLEAYRGEWLLINGYELIAHSADFGEIKASIAARNVRSPFIYYVPTEEESNFVWI